MALLANHVFQHPAMQRARQVLQSRMVQGVGYGIAAGLTGLAILLAASPPSTGPLGPVSQVIQTVLGLNLILILALIAAVALRIGELLDARAEDPGARLQVRFARLFALAAVAPAAVVFVFYGVLVNRGVESWFSHRVQTVVENSATVFRSYIEEQTNYIQDHLTPMSLDLNREAPNLAKPGSADGYLATLASYHGFAAAYLIDRDSHILSRAESQGSPAYMSPPKGGYQAADSGEIYVPDFGNTDVMRALYRLRAYPNVYLYVARPLQPGIIAHLREAEGSLVSYRDAAQNRRKIQVIFFLAYFETALLVLVGAVWLGL